MAQAEIILFWITVFIYLASFCSAVFGFVMSKPLFLRRSVTVMTLGLIVHTIAIAIRWIAGGHMPVTDAYELNLIGMWFTVLLFLFFYKMGKADPHVVLLIGPVVFLVLGHGYIVRTQPTPMKDAYNSLWLVVHVIFAWLAFGSYAISTGAALLLILKNKLAIWRPNAKIPDVNTLDVTSYRFIILGFINHAVMIVSGAIWAKKLWGQYWSWDALETWSLIAFLFYAFYLHARSFLEWKLKRAAWLAVFGLVVMAISFWGVGWFAPSVHPGP